MFLKKTAILSRNEPTYSAYPTLKAAVRGNANGSAAISTFEKNLRGGNKESLNTSVRIESIGATN
jgi:hypothetical protein